MPAGDRIKPASARLDGPPVIMTVQAATAGGTAVVLPGRAGPAGGPAHACAIHAYDGEKIHGQWRRGMTGS